MVSYRIRHSILIAGLVSAPLVFADEPPAAPTPIKAEAAATAEAPALVPLDMPVVSDVKPKADVKARTSAKRTKTAAPAAPVASAAPKPKPKAAVTPQDIDLWAFTSAGALATGKTLDEFKALPAFVGEQSVLLNGDLEATDTKGKPKLVTLTYRDGLRVRVIDYGTQAFVTQVKVNGPGRVLKDDIKVGSSRAEVEAALGVPSRGGGNYSLYQGSSDSVRFFYSNNVVTSVEIDRGS